MTVKLSTRADWRCPGGYDRPIPHRLGWSIHYPGPGRFRFSSHDQCLSQVRSWDQMHRNRGSAMLEYGGLVCQHGYYIEGRGTWGDLMQQPGSNGTAHANQRYPSLQLMMGTDDAPPTDQEYRWAAEVVARGFAQGLAEKVIGHRDTYATACPGDPIYNNLSTIKRYALDDTPPPPPKDWFDMATEEELRQIVREEVARMFDHGVSVAGTDRQKKPFYWFVSQTHMHAKAADEQTRD